MKIATAFSGGLAAPEFALKYEGIEHEVIFACEWDKYARKQYLEFHGEPQTFYNDISDLDARKYKGEIDLFVWGSPCQDLSLAGKRKGFDGEKSSLFREGARVMSEMMPKIFIFENVKGLLSSNKGADFEEVLDTFWSMGYYMASKVLNAKEHGTAQNRERIFVVGFLDVNEYHDFTFEEPVKLEKVLRDYLEDDVDEKYFLSDKVIKSMINPKYESMGIDRVNKEDDVSNCLTTMGGGNREPKVMIKKIGYINQDTQGSAVYCEDGISPGLCAGSHGYAQGYIKVKSATSKGYETATENDSINFTHPDSKTRRGRVGKGVAQTLDCSCNQGVIDGYDIRKYTPRECFRLQGIKEEDINLINSDTQSYKIAGNAIEVNTMRSIVRALYKPQPKGTLF